MKQAGGDAAEAAKETASTAGIRVKNGYEAVKQSAGEIAHTFSRAVAPGAGKVEEGAKKVADSAGVAVQNTIQKVKQDLQQQCPRTRILRGCQDVVSSGKSRRGAAAFVSEFFPRRPVARSEGACVYPRGQIGAYNPPLWPG